ncbi:MAG: APC family permease [Candidatus Cryosericum sp.]
MAGEKGSLRREISLLTLISISAGAVIGGWVAEAPYWFKTTGAGSALLFPILAILLIPVGLAIAEMTSMMPVAAGPLAFTTLALGRDVAFWTHWMFFLVQVIEPPLISFIFATIVTYFTGTTSFLLVKLLTVGFLLIWFVITMYNIGFIGKLANVLFVVMIAGSIIVGVTFFASGHWTMANVTGTGGWFPSGWYGAAIGMAVLVLKYIGFELVPSLSEEVNFPKKDFWKVILSALIIPGVLYTFAVLAIAGMAPWQTIAGWDLPEARIVTMYKLPYVIALIALGAGILHALTTMAGFWLSSARALYGFSQLGFLPKGLLKTNSKGQPWIANIVVLALSLFFVIWTPTAWVQYTYSVSCVAGGILYFMLMIDFWVLRKRFPDRERQYRAPGGFFGFAVGALISVWIVIGSLLELPSAGYYSFGVFILIGIVVWLVGRKYQREGKWKSEIELS